MEIAAPPPRLAVAGMSKTFGAVRVLHDVALDVSAGEIHALVGHNGSGKSTLVKIIAGVHRPDGGCRVALDGEPIHVPTTARELIDRGVSIVHQDLGLIDSLSVTENCRVGRYRARGLHQRIRWSDEHEVTREVLRRLDSDLDPRLPVGLMSAAGRATVALARAIQDQQPGSGIIILDEATRALPRPAQEHLYELVRGVTAAGGSALMITHHAGEVLALADRVSVLRDGRLVAHGRRTADLDEPALGQLLIGRRSGASSRVAPPPRTAAGREWHARVEGLSGATLREVTADFHAGEVLGITGPLDSGISELPELLTGARRAVAGELRLREGTIDLSRRALRRCLDAGIVLIPERRDRDGLELSLSVRDNLALPLLRRNNRAWRTRGDWEIDLLEKSVAELDIRLASGDQPVGSLSGGNRQKVLLGKWLATGPKLLVLHEPTQGVDIAARAQLLAQIRRAAASGVAAVIVSIEAEELAGACDRILILRDGRIDAELTGPCDGAEIVQRIYLTQRHDAELAQLGKPIRPEAMA
jgi:ribose transport system ATP-binding protein